MDRETRLNNRKIIEIEEEQRVYQGFFQINLVRFRHSLYRGGWSETVAREVFRRGDCVALLPYDPRTDQVVLIEQLRVGALHTGEQAWLTEIVAGIVEAGETPDGVAYREAREEAGCRIDALHRIGRFYTSPGGSSECVTLYCGRVDAEGLGGIHGLREEHEDICVEVVQLEEALEKVNSGAICSAIPMIALQWLALNRQHLIACWNRES